jgi:hypothetical protein
MCGCRSVRAMFPCECVVCECVCECVCVCPEKCLWRVAEPARFYCDSWGSCVCLFVCVRVRFWGKCCASAVVLPYNLLVTG